MRRWRPSRPWRIVGASVLVLTLVLALLFTWTASRYARSVRGLARGVGDTIFLSSDGQPWFRLDETRHDVDLAAISPHMQHAVVAVEDRRFYMHPGLDPIGITRALVRAARPGTRAEGASTLTQQLARTLYLSNARTVGRKFREASIALLMEFELTKPQILELYLNRIYLSAGVYGVQAMSEQLYGKPAKALTLPEAALIAGLIRAPSTLSPWSNYEAAWRRSHTVLAQMRQQGFITSDEEKAARDVRPSIRPYRVPAEGASGWAKDYLRQQFRDVFGGDHPPDWTVRTTFDRRLQRAAEQAVAGGLQRLRRRGLQAAFVALDPKSGDVLAMVGGADYRTSTFNRAVRSRRQPGSAFKPFVYAAALSRGYSPVSEVTNLDRVTVPGDPDWNPRNAGHEISERMTLRDALVESNNAAAAVLLQKVSTKPVLELAAEAGLQHLPDVPSLALGTGEVTVLDIAGAYTAFAAEGVVARPRSLLSVRDADRVEVFTQEPTRGAVLDPAVAFQMVSLLRDVVDRGTGQAVRALGVRGPVAGKTGTTDDYHDAWFVGFSTEIVAAVWVGFDKPQPIGASAYAAQVAAPIWADFMKRAASVRPAREFPRPAGVKAVTLCAVSHELAGDECPAYTEYFKSGDDIPDDDCHVHRQEFQVRVAKAVEGLLRSLGGRLSSIFRR